MKNLRRASIQKQILVLATLLVVLVSVIATLSEPFIYGRNDRDFQNGLFAGQAEMVLDRFRTAGSTHEEDAVLTSAARLGIRAERAPAAQFSFAQEEVASPDEIVERIKILLASSLFSSTEHLWSGQPNSHVLAVKVDAGRALIFYLPVFPPGLWVVPGIVSGLLKIVVPLFLLGILSSWLITNPLQRFAAAAKRASLDDSVDEVFEPDGALELRSLAESLNIMRRRIQNMVQDRTMVLSGVGHDLRTPLTRLRMRVERSEEPELRHLMLADIATLTSMVDECLAYFKDPSAGESLRRADLPSLLQTIATDFSDTGVNVTYEGPRRLAYACRPQALTRALSNLIDNASRYATQIELTLQSEGDGGVQMKVIDNGPGLTDELKAKVLEPFFKADKSRQIGRKGGFGLGLPIAKGIIIKGHNGQFTLRDAEPSGLVIVIDLPPA
ncbi:HAMP domain-containing protein [Agrobacterium rhizogenes]|uniref:HAMP domain-containing sensor histidine kinase n=1 Tax=Rhizobium rhizogenes TaxID=359 RepID=UPI0015726F00|nr:ATP-binding protein [Rhizobium rhizogenes]NTF59500.1 HAMP domain-containing protein [Rhizobium rhizogenes]NTF79060.1 HAMP domain-containing protein [Rhizobium rhizogenes]NTG18291.1 HAMP domain-containing protein [Rhizobium rhizogenes]NTH55452.1 HAMP domain-containing protein [Rhizobium rhizogenes]NTH75035.1 HAMP domain-containing protein [Rhizobium rhizogenes]